MASDVVDSVIWPNQLMDFHPRDSIAESGRGSSSRSTFKAPRIWPSKSSPRAPAIATSTSSWSATTALGWGSTGCSIPTGRPPAFTVAQKTGSRPPSSSLPRPAIFSQVSPPRTRDPADRTLRV